MQDVVDWGRANNLKDYVNLPAMLSTQSDVPEEKCAVENREGTLPSDPRASSEDESPPKLIAGLTTVNRVTQSMQDAVDWGRASNLEEEGFMQNREVIPHSEL